MMTRSGRLSALETGLERTVTALKEAGKSVVLVYPIPEVGYDVPTTLAQIEASGRSASEFVRSVDLYWARQRSVSEILDRIGDGEKITRIYPHSLLCDDTECLTFAQGTPLYRDDDHLSVAGAEFIAPLFERVFTRPD